MHKQAETAFISVCERLAQEGKVHPSKVSFNQFKKEASPELLDALNINIQDPDSSSFFKNLKNTVFPRKEVTGSDLDLVGLKVTATSNKKLFESLSKNEYFIDKLSNNIKDIFTKKIIVKSFPHKKAVYPTRELNLMISDTHFQSLLSTSNGTLEYGSVQEARRLACVIKQTCEYKLEYRDHTTLNIHLLGDIIAGGIHFPREGAQLAKQASAAIYLLSQAIAYAATMFPKVKVSCSPGNHGRWPDHKDRDLIDKSDCLESVIYFGVKSALRHVPNVEFHIPNIPYYIHKGVGGNLFMTHGDTVFNPGNVGSQINVRSLEQQANRMKTSLDPSIRVFGCGHVHTPVIVYLNNGSAVIINGSLIPTDQYAQGIGIFSNTCGQWLFESVKDYPLGDSRLLIVDSYTDKDATLDNIIAPFNGFNS